MPSQSYIKFETNLLIEVERIIESHAQTKSQWTGKKRFRAYYS